jgi:oxalate decarboxylase/phosphoglucose isomerase-like protein (cupin superfamily)
MKVVVAEVPLDRSLDARTGWHDMDVQWLVTKANVGAKHGVFGLTVFPPGARHDIHRHPNAEEVEYLIQGEGVARVGDDDVAMGVGDTVFVSRNEYHGFRNTSDTETAIMAWYYAGAASLDEAGYIRYVDDHPA